jgi:hypothetical protein
VTKALVVYEPRRVVEGVLVDGLPPHLRGAVRAQAPEQKGPTQEEIRRMAEAQRNAYYNSLRASNMFGGFW